jgi:hypothetical protein
MTDFTRLLQLLESDRNAELWELLSDDAAMADALRQMRDHHFKEAGVDVEANRAALDALDAAIDDLCDEDEADAGGANDNVRVFPLRATQDGDPLHVFRRAAASPSRFKPVAPVERSEKPVPPEPFATLKLAQGSIEFSDDGLVVYAAFPPTATPSVIILGNAEYCVASAGEWSSLFAVQGLSPRTAADVIEAHKAAPESNPISWR